MFRRISTLAATSSTTRRDLGVKFCDGHGISTRTERSARRLEAARSSAGNVLPRV
jgi:hypothetical protein